MTPINTIQVIRRFSFEEWGGTETVVWNTLQQMQTLGGLHELVATAALDHIGQEIVDNIKINRFPYFYPRLNLNSAKKQLLDKKGGNPYSWQLYRHLTSSRDVSLIHCHTMQRLATIVRLAAAKKNIPYIVSLHGGNFSVPQSEIEEMIKPYQGTFNYGKILDVFLGNSKFLDRANGIICVGYNEYEATCERYPDKLVEYIPNGVNLDKFDVNVKTSVFRQKYNIPDNAKLILCVSRIDYQKNQLLLIELLNKLRLQAADWHLLLIGPLTSPPYYDKLTERITKYGLERQVTIIKGLKGDDPDLVAAYKSADYFILPSRHEPFGIVALEAWAASIPVIASGVGGLKKLINHEQTGMVFEDDSLDDLHAKLELLQDQPAFQEKLVMNALQEVKSSYTWQVVVKKVLAFYELVLANYHGRD